MEKKCSKCKKNKGVEEFSRDKSKKDGLTSACRECNNKREKNKGKMAVISLRSRNKQSSRGSVKFVKCATVKVICK
jgi:hypothetical protein